MKLDAAPQAILVRLMQLDDRANAAARAADVGERELARSRSILAGREPPPGIDPGNLNVKALTAAVAPIRENFDSQLKATQRARQNADNAMRVSSACKAWIGMLPDDAELEPITVDTGGLELPGVRARLKQIASELGALEAAPVPSPDLLERVADYVDGLARAARPFVDGIGSGAPLRVLWPADANASRGNLAGFSEVGSTLLFMAALFPHQLARLVMNSAELDCQEPLPVAERPARIAQLKAELDVMWRLQAALVNAAVADGRDETHDPATPAQCVLGVSVGAVELAPIAMSA